MFRFLVFVMVASVVFIACEQETEIVQPNSDLTMSYTDFGDNAPAAPAIRGGWQNMSCVEFNNGIHDWASIRVTEGVGTNAVDRHIVVHASLVHIPSGQNYVVIFTPQGFIGASFDIVGDNLKFHRSLADAKAEGNPIHLFRCNPTPSDATHIVYEAETFDDDRVNKADATTNAPVLDEVRDGTAEQGVYIVPIGDVDTINFATGEIIINSSSTIPDTITNTALTAGTYGTPTELKDRTRVKFFSSQAAAETYAIPIRMRRTLFEAIARWYSIGLYVKVHGEAGGTFHHGDGDSNSGFERIQRIYDTDFPETDAEKRQFIRSRFTSNTWRTGFDDGNTTFNFAGPFETREEAAAFNHVTAAGNTTYTTDKLALRVSFEDGVRTAVAQRDMFVGGTFGGSVFAAFEIGIYTDSTANDIVRGVMTATGDAGVPSIVTFGGVTLTRKSIWSFREGTTVPAGLVDSLKDFFGFANTWARTSIPATAPTRVNPVPALLVYNPTTSTFSTTDPLNLYSIPNAHQIKWYANATAAGNAITSIQNAARVYTYFNVTQ